MTLPPDYKTNPGHDPCEDHIGPFFYRTMQGRHEYAFEATSQHANVTGIVHGGVLMTFADYSACMEATDHYAGEDCVTISFSCDFIGAAEVGDTLTCDVQINRRTRSMVFTTGRILAGGEVVFTFSSVMKRLPHDKS